MKRIFNFETEAATIGGFLFSLILCAFFSQLIIVQPVFGQIVTPDKKHTFIEDSPTKKNQNKSSEASIIKEDKNTSEDVSLSAPTVDYQNDRGLVSGSGGALLTGNGVRSQADSITLNTQTKEATLAGDVLFSTMGGKVTSHSGSVNIETEQGTFQDSTLTLDQGDYTMTTPTLKKLSEFDYELEDASFSTCNCDSGTPPWSIECSHAAVTDGGYSHTYNTVFKAYGVPILYSPYFVFPAKRERASGFLAPRIKSSNEDGFGISLPFFLVLGDSSDLLITPFNQALTRDGVSFDYRQAFSQYHTLEAHALYSDESRRGNALRGVTYYDPSNSGTPITSLDQMTSRSFNSDRVGVYYNEAWIGSPDAFVPGGLITDIHWVSDDLYLRELQDDLIGDYRSSYLASTAALRVSPVQWLSAQVGGEYDEYLDATNDKFVFQRGPEFTLSELKTLRPFGFNPYGIKLITSSKIVETTFTRNTGYEGRRYDINPGVTIPTRFSNYVSNSLQLTAHRTGYDLTGNDFTDPKNALVGQVDDSKIRDIYQVSDSVGTSVERVFDVEKGGFLQTLTGLGAVNKDSELVRVKHTFLPSIQYSYVPPVDQTTNPFFDGLDRIKPISVFTFHLDNTIMGRFLPRNKVEETIQELAPAPEDLPVINMDKFPSSIGGIEDYSTGAPPIVGRRGSVTQLMDFGVAQSYDLDVARQNIIDSPNSSPFSALHSYVDMYPTQNLGFSLSNDYDRLAHRVRQWKIGTSVQDDRTDLIRAAYNYLDNGPNTISQLEGNAEIRLTDRLRFGYYTRYDDFNKKFFEKRSVFRFYGGCHCWSLDIGYTDKFNPDKKEFIFQLTFTGLGSIAEKALYQKPDSTGGSTGF